MSTIYLRVLVRSDRGAGMVEYAFLVAFIALVLLISLSTIGDTLAEWFNRVTNVLDSP